MNEDSVIIKCHKCGARNRIPVNRLGDKPVCGKCRAPLPETPVYHHPVDITDQTFSREVLSFPGLVLLDCWAPWCAPCRMVAPILDELAGEYSGRLKIAKLDVDQNPHTASKYAIQSIPSMLFFKNGQQVHKVVGALPKHEIEKNLKAFL